MTAIKAVVLDWAGTTVDHGSLAPVGVFVELFRREGVPVSMEIARGPMGVHKRDHIKQVIELPDVTARWTATKGAPPTDADIDRMYAAATPMQIEVLPHYCDLIDGLLDTVAARRAKGIRIGSTSGYNREMLDVVVRLAAAKGYTPDCAIAASEVPQGRPAPYLNWRAAEAMGVWPASACVAVGDTLVDVQAGRTAGFWSVGLARTGNMVGVNAADWAALPAAEQEARLTRARAALTEAGAHLVIDTIADLPAAIEALELRAAASEA
jgi:phosphonoacetaldehyde hydrolase